MKRSVVENCSPQTGYISAIAADIKRLHSAALLRDTAGRDSHARVEPAAEGGGRETVQSECKNDLAIRPIHAMTFVFVIQSGSGETVRFAHRRSVANLPASALCDRLAANEWTARSPHVRQFEDPTPYFFYGPA